MAGPNPPTSPPATEDGSGPTGSTGSTGREHGRRRALRYSAGAVVAALLAAWAVWMTVAGSTGAASQLQSVDVHSEDAVTVYFEVAKEPGVPAACTVLVTGARGQRVGHARVSVPASAERAELSRRLATSARAAKAQVGDCRLHEPR